MTLTEIRNAYIKAVAKENNITTPDKLLALHQVLSADINSVPWNELEKLFEYIRGDSAEQNTKISNVRTGCKQ